MKKEEYMGKIFLSLISFCLFLSLVLTSSMVNAALRTYLYVDINARSSAEIGTESDPYRTITDALNRARLLRRRYRWISITIQVQPGFYSEANGETFPLHMESRVDIEGIYDRMGPESFDPDRPIIMGGANYAIPGTSRYVTILGANSASISGFIFYTIDGPDSTSGTSILCDNTSPIIIDNTFKGNGHAGITTIGRAHPRILNNNFERRNNWGITLYGESYPRIESNKFYGRKDEGKGGVDCSDLSYPTISGNTFYDLCTSISTKWESNPTIVNNDITGSEYGIIIRMNSTPMIQENDITSNNYGIYIGGGSGQDPDIGGSGRSQGKNLFNDNDWDIANYTRNEIMARNNRWSSFCCEWIDSGIYDDDENSFYGEVDFSGAWCYVFSWYY